MNVDELKEVLSKLSKPDIDKLLKNLQRISFDFKVNKSFLSYTSHPITIPKEFYTYLDIHGITKKQEATIVFPDDSIAQAYIHYSVAGYGEYYQIRIGSPYTGKGMSNLRIGNVVNILLLKEVDNTRIILSIIR